MKLVLIGGVMPSSGMNRVVNGQNTALEYTVLACKEPIALCTKCAQCFAQCFPKEHSAFPEHIVLSIELSIELPMRTELSIEPSKFDPPRAQCYKSA